MSRSVRPQKSTAPSSETADHLLGREQAATTLELFSRVELAPLLPSPTVDLWPAKLRQRMRVVLHTILLTDLQRNQSGVQPDIRPYDALALKSSQPYRREHGHGARGRSPFRGTCPIAALVCDGYRARPRARGGTALGHLQRAAIRITNLKPSRHVGSLADAQRSASIGLTLGGALMVGFSLPLILIWIRSLTLLRSFIGLPGT